MFTQIGTPPCRVSTEAVLEMEEAFARYRLVERDELYKCIGGGFVPRNRDAKGWNKLRHDLRKPFDSFYEGFELQARKPESTPSASQASESKR